MHGRTISHYRIVSTLGAGGMGVVYKAEDLRLKRLVALKFLSAERTQNEEAKQRFVQEAQAASALDHPNICTVYEIDETSDGQLFIAMAFYGGETLQQRIRRGPLPVVEALEIAIQVTEGVARAHRSGIVHRDLKPANIILTAEGTAKVLDFGLAKLADQAGVTQTGMIVGTPSYMSPEQMTGAPADATCDVWALGVTLYESLTGRLPFVGEMPWAMLDAIEHERPPLRSLRPDVPESLCLIAEKSLSMRREVRYPSAVELLNDLRACQAALTRAAAFGPPPRRVSRPIAAALLGMALLGLVAAAMAWRSREDTRRTAEATLRLREVERLSDAGEFAAAFALAREVERRLPGSPELASLWPTFSYTVAIDSMPRGARVQRQRIDDPAGSWEAIGATPLKDVRFVQGAGYRIRLELAGHRPVDLLHTALLGAPLGGLPGFNPVTLDAERMLPASMVRIPGFRAHGTDYEAFFMDRFEVTNRDYQAFVDAGGYRTRGYWTAPFVANGKAVSWDEAMDAFKDQTGRPGPSTWQLGRYPDGQSDNPVGGVSWYEAAAYARFVQKDLPTSEHWRQALRFFRDDSWMVLPRSNFDGSGPRSIHAGNALNTFGIADLVGNVREWCYNTAGAGRVTRGGAWTDSTFHALWIIPKDPFDRDATNGFRLVRTFDGDEKLAKLRTPVSSSDPRDYRRERPVSDAEFTIFRRLYAYAAPPVSAVVEARASFPDWIRETIAFDLPYDERGGAVLFLPRRAARPLQTVIYWPGSYFVALRSADDVPVHEFDFLIKSGRAVALPIFKGALHRDPNDSIGPAATVGSGISPLAYRDLLVQWVKEFSRTIDYIHTRDDLDRARIGFFAYSWGGLVAPVVLATETRVKATVLNVGGLWNGTFLPEADAFNFAPRVQSPVLMINGEHDIVYPLETSQKPLFERLGTPLAHKRHYLLPASHHVPRNALIRQTLDWFDRYLDAVK